MHHGKREQIGGIAWIEIEGLLEERERSLSESRSPSSGARATILPATMIAIRLASILFCSSSLRSNLPRKKRRRLQGR
jgi:hypothetical protein